MLVSGDTDKGGVYSGLCRPAEDRACFGCCPPIRPAGYDHLDHRAAMERALRENTEAKAADENRFGWISGDRCWGLGYLDPERRLVGCMLHPAQNNGRDLRDQTGYGEKCRRELCREAVRYERLSSDAKGMILDLTGGLDAFEYSSHRANPAFRLLLWSDAVVEKLAQAEPDGFNRDAYFQKYQFLAVRLDPLVHGYGVEMLLRRMELAEIGDPAFLDRYEAGMGDLISRFTKRINPPYDNRPFVHQLDIQAGLVSFLRHGPGWQRTLQSEANAAQRELDALLDHL